MERFDRSIYIEPVHNDCIYDLFNIVVYKQGMLAEFSRDCPFLTYACFSVSRECSFWVGNVSFEVSNKIQVS